MTRQRRGHTLYGAYTWRYCPYSEGWTDGVTTLELYKELFYDEGYRGPSTNPELRSDSWVPFTTSPHTTTSGRMTYKHSGYPGFICWDPNCYYYTTNSGYYFEC
jgi:hypothetical protein